MEIRLERNDEVVGGVGEYTEYLLDGHIPLETLVLGGVP